MTGKCQGRLSGCFGGNCERRASITRGGRGYCWQHDPERVSRERKAKAQQLRQEIRRREERIDAEVERSALHRRAGLDSLTDDDIRNIISLGGIQSMIYALATYKRQ